MGKPRVYKKRRGGYATMMDDDSDEGQDRVLSRQLEPSRKSKRNLHKNSNLATQNDFLLRQAVEENGTRTIIDVEADGNCLFRAISDQLYYDYGNKHTEVRHDICDFIEGHKDDFALFLALEDDHHGEDSAGDFESYCRHMRSDGDWGGHIELVAAAKLYRRNITVFQATMEAFTIEHGSMTHPSAGPDLLLSFHDNDHYNSVRRTSGGRPPPPIKTYTAPTSIDNYEDHIYATSGTNEIPSTSTIKVRENEEMMILEEDARGNAAMSTTSSESTECSNTALSPTGVSNVSNSQEEVSQRQEQKLLVKRNAQCPCKSGLRYKKCCLAREKQISRLGRIQNAATSTGMAVDSENKSEIGNFRVLRI